MARRSRPAPSAATSAALIAALLAVALAGCLPRHVPTGRRIGQALAIAGVLGMMVTAAAGPYIDGEAELVTGFSVMSAAGIGTFAVADLSDPPRAIPPETETQKLRRWARILTERASGAAREGRCPRVRRLERRVFVYDREVHDFVFMRDPEILRCLPAAPPPADETAPPPAEDTAAPPPAEPAPRVAPPASPVP